MALESSGDSGEDVAAKRTNVICGGNLALQESLETRDKVRNRGIVAFIS